MKVVEISTRAWVRANLVSLFVSPFPNLHTSAGVARNNVMRGSYRTTDLDGTRVVDRSPHGDLVPDRDVRTDFDVLPTEIRHGPGAYDVIHLANGYPLDAERRALHARMVAQQLERFPEGQFVAVTVRDGEELVVGTATTMRTRRPPEARSLSWHAVIGDYGLPRHDPEGDWLYGVEIAVHPDHQRRGIASALYRARLALVPELGLNGWYAGGMLMGYHRYADVLTPRAYAERVIAGELIDPTVTMQLNRGLRPSGIIEGYYPEPKAGDCAVLLVWQPPVTAPAKGAGRVGVGARTRRSGIGGRPQAPAPQAPAARAGATAPTPAGDARN